MAHARALSFRARAGEARATLRERRGRKSSIVARGTTCGKVEKMNAEELEIAMANRETPMVIDFYATWCGPCVLMSAELEKVQERLGDAVRCVKVDTDEETELATQLQIQGLPTLVFVSPDQSKPALRTEGMLPAETVISVIENELS
ncbi:Thioredoxin, conserved site [Ostreococcus tauri]|uniref:Thioredoxin, conserved site n=1 Tax=Ostreococcus tauri TaxID=70448 RepID=Q01AW2_OSTTA|nr:Thioredoxin, conserved site [Ostreococcus tauri]CAL51686.1 Thioredoxin, conserved site [Ostreococcus tauri]|eukprot:XP_003078806.1 Thioredoxin, conserved site [Ostreococcus tauri]